MLKQEIDKYLGCKIGLETNAGRYVFGTLKEIDSSSIKIEFLNKARTLIIPVCSIISIKLLKDDEHD